MVAAPHIDIGPAFAQRNSASAERTPVDGAGGESRLSKMPDSLRRASFRYAVLLGLALAVATCVIARHIGKGEFSINVDEAFHACTGLFVASFMHDLPV